MTCVIVACERRGGPSWLAFDLTRKDDRGQYVFCRVIYCRFICTWRLRATGAGGHTCATGSCCWPPRWRRRCVWIRWSRIVGSWCSSTIRSTSFAGGPPSSRHSWTRSSCACCDNCGVGTRRKRRNNSYNRSTSTRKTSGGRITQTMSMRPPCSERPPTALDKEEASS